MKKISSKRKINKNNLWTLIISGAALIFSICIIAGSIVMIVLLADRPQLNLQDFEQTESSVIYDAKGEEVANLGSVIRKNASYEQLPNCLVDAFVAIEDSRFFQHNGFDLPRFTKAILENLKTLSFGQGGSTFTMQLIKNTYFTNDETGEEASRSGVSGVKRKLQEISLALKLEKYEPKHFIFESYLNKLNYGGTRNIRGIEKASQYYFGKNVSQLNLNEAAFLAGVINAPYYYSPFTQDSDGTFHIEQAQEREEEVLYQMYNHGYISKDEYKLALSVKIEDLLQDPAKNSSNGDNEGIPYQAYVDAVVNEVIDITGMDPYTSSMNIYTYMNKDIQDVMDDIQGQGKDDYVGFPDEFMEAASVCIDNSTGQVVAILGGRSYSKGGELLLNHATEQYKQPGSSIKPILDYALAFENLGWATDHVLVDEPIYMDQSKQNVVFNFNNEYHGDSTLKEALGNSSNSCAIQTLQAVLDKMKYEYVVNYTKSLGYNFNLDNFNIQYAIGGSSCEVTPLQHAAAYSSIFNGGKYIEPHTVSRIEFKNGKSPFSKTYETNQVISEEAAFLTTELMKSNVRSYGGSYNYVKSDDYIVYGKTGTTDWSTAGLDYGIPAGANKDAWLVAATSEYTTVTWIGYEKAVKGQQSYITDNCYYNIRPQARIAHLVLDACYEYGDSKPVEISKPSGISTIAHILGAQSYDKKKGIAIYYSTTDDVYENGLIQKSYGLLKSDLKNCYTYNSETKEITQTPDNATISISGENSPSAFLTLTWPKYGSNGEDDEDSSPNGQEEEKTKTLSIPSGSYSFSYVHKHYFDESWIFGGIEYAADVYVNDNLVEHVTSSDNEKNVNIGDVRNGATIKVDMYYQYESGIATSGKVTKTLNQDVVRNVLTPISTTPSVSTYLSWCEENGVQANFEIINTGSEGLSIIIDNNINVPLTSIPSEGYEINASSTVTSTYKIFIKLTAVKNGNTITITSHPSDAINSDAEWITPDDDENTTYTKNGNILTITVPDDTAISNLHNISVNYGNGLTSSTIIPE